MIYYLLLLLVLIVFCFITKNDNKTRKKVTITIMVILLTLVAGLRHYMVGSDTIIYYNSYNRMATYGSALFDTSYFEIGYNYLVLFATSLGLDFNAFLLIISLIMNIGAGVFIYKY